MGTVRLSDALRGELECLEALLECARQKAEAAVNDDLAGLLSILERECSLADRVKIIDGERVEAVAELAASLAITSPSPSLGEIVRSLPSEDGRALEGLRRDILSSAERLRSANTRNAALITQALEFTNFNLRLLGTGSGHAGYNRDGGRTEAAPSAVVDEVF